jgi:hypothetical protein
VKIGTVVEDDFDGHGDDEYVFDEPMVDVPRVTPPDNLKRQKKRTKAPSGDDDQRAPKASKPLDTGESRKSAPRVPKVSKPLDTAELRPPYKATVSSREERLLKRNENKGLLLRYVPRDITDETISPEWIWLSHNVGGLHPNFKASRVMLATL